LAFDQDGVPIWEAVFDNPGDLARQCCLHDPSCQGHLAAWQSVCQVYALVWVVRAGLRRVEWVADETVHFFQAVSRQR
jgi:hypothetical protein